MEFWDIYEQYHDKIRKFILSYVKSEFIADDIVQDTFMRVMQKGETLKDQEKLSSWIFRIAHNLCIDHFRSSKKTSGEGEEVLKNIEDSKELGQYKKQEMAEMGACVREKVDMLPDSLKSVLKLYDVMGFSQKEIADILEIEVGAVKVRLHRARKQMKTILTSACIIENDDRGTLTCERTDSESKK